MSKRDRAFTLIELLVVMAIIIILAGLILGTSGYVQKKGARSRAEAEIAAMSAALESYKADNGIYPTNTDTEALAANKSVDPSAAAYENASLYLYKAISGDPNATRSGGGKSYMNFKPNMLKPTPPSTAPVIAIRDPFGYSYGYSTIKAKAPSGTDGYNPTFDLWSTAGTTGGQPLDQNQWIKNW
ncbi:MAG: type II secretion system protein [Chthoniobacterales bacterium]